MAIFRRRRDQDSSAQEPESVSLEEIEQFLDDPFDEGGDDRDASEALDPERASLEARLLESLGPRDRGSASARPATTTAPPSTPEAAESDVADVAASIPPVEPKDRPDRPDPGSDIARAMRRAVTRALAEDLGDDGDVTSVATVLPLTTGTATLVAREAGVIAGIELVAETWRQVDTGVTVSTNVSDGDRVEAGQVLGTVRGSLRSILTGERVALNLLGHLSGIATTTARYVAAVAGTDTAIRDTRKTTPGLRLLEKMAVVAGGGVNHRLGLFDALLVKDNHNLAAGDVSAATLRALDRANGRPVQVEVSSIEEMDAAVEAGATDILLDNFDLEDLEIAVQRVPAEVVVEASGGVTLENVADVAATGVHRIAIGALTHSTEWLDVALDVTDVETFAPDAAEAPGVEPAETETTADDAVLDFDDEELDGAPDTVGTEPAADDEPLSLLGDDAEFAPLDGAPAQGEVVPLDEPTDTTDVADDAAEPRGADHLWKDLGLHDDTAVEELASVDDDVPVPDDDLVDAFLDELDRDAGDSTGPRSER